MAGQSYKDDSKLKDSMKTYEELLEENQELRTKVNHVKKLSLVLLGIALTAIGAVIAILLNFVSLDSRNCERD